MNHDGCGGGLPPGETDAMPRLLASATRFARSLAATETALLAIVTALLAAGEYGRDTAKTRDLAARTTGVANRTTTAENHIDNVAGATHWDPNSVGGGWSPNSVPCCTQCNSRFGSIAQIFDNLDSQLNTRFNSIQSIFENMRAAGLY